MGFAPSTEMRVALVLGDVRAKTLAAKGGGVMVRGCGKDWGRRGFGARALSQQHVNLFGEGAHRARRERIGLEIPRAQSAQGGDAAARLSDAQSRRRCADPHS